MFNALVVDDEEDISNDVKAELERLGFQVTTAISGEKALDLISKGAWQLALVDLRLATKITGLDVIKAMRQKHPRAIVAAMTGYIDIALKQETEKLGVHAYLSKPDDLMPDTFERKIKALF